MLLAFIEGIDLLQFAIFNVFLDANEIVFDLAGDESFTIKGSYSRMFVTKF